MALLRLGPADFPKLYQRASTVALCTPRLKHQNLAKSSAPVAPPVITISNWCYGVHPRLDTVFPFLLKTYLGILEWPMGCIYVGWHINSRACWVIAGFPHLARHSSQLGIKYPSSSSAPVKSSPQRVKSSPAYIKCTILPPVFLYKLCNQF